MKWLSITGLYIFLHCSAQAQKSAADSLKEYIKTHHYVLITRKAKLPRVMQPYYQTIMDSLANWNPEHKNYYVSLSTFTDDKGSIFFKIYQLSDIAFVRKWENTKRIVAEKNKTLQKDSNTVKGLPNNIVATLQLVDDYGGSDGGIGILFTYANHKVRQIFYQ